MLIMLLQDSSNLRLLIHDLERSRSYNLLFVGGCMPYYSEIINDKLIVGFSNTGMISINYCDKSQCTKLGKCLRYYEMVNHNDAFLLLEAHKGIFVNEPEKMIDCGDISRIYANCEGNLILYTQKSNKIKILCKNGLIDEFALTGIRDVSFIGVNSDSNQVYIGTKSGNVSVFE